MSPPEQPTLSEINAEGYNQYSFLVFFTKAISTNKLNFLQQKNEPILTLYDSYTALKVMNQKVDDLR